MKNALKCLVFGCTIFSILACSVGNLLFNQALTPPSTALPTNVVQAGGAPPLPQNVTITSQSSYTKTAEINSFLTSNITPDSEALVVLNWARDKGYLPKTPLPTDATQAIFSNGVTLNIVDFSNNTSQPIAFLRFVIPGGKSLPTMATVQGDANDPVVVLFSQFGQLRYSKEGRMVDAPVNSSKIVPVSLLTSLDAQSNTCTDNVSGLFDRWRNCVHNHQSAAYVAAGACIQSIIAYRKSAKPSGALGRNVVTATINSAEFLAVIVACGVGAVICAGSALNDYPPVLTPQINLMVGKQYLTCIDATKYTEYPAYQVVVNVEDDRNPPPEPPGFMEILPPNATANYSARDCANQRNEITVHTPAYADRPVYECPATQVCQQNGPGNIECVPGVVQPPAVQPPAVQPPAVQPPATTGIKTYQGQDCGKLSSSGPGNCECKKLDPVTFTIQFNPDGSLTLLKRAWTSGTVSDYHETFTQLTDGLYVFTMDPQDKYSIQLVANGLTYTFDWYIHGSPPCSSTTQFTQVGP